MSEAQGNEGRRVRLALNAAVAAGLMSLFAAGAARAETTITIAPDTGSNQGCHFFGGVSDVISEWRPHGAFFYKDIPPFELKVGDEIAFDLLATNDADIQLEIALARTTVNGGTDEAEPFTTVVQNTQTASNPRGDSTTANYDLRYIAEAPYSFLGGGLIIRFRNPSPAYEADSTCTSNQYGTSSSDTSGFFVGRSFQDSDGVAPWDSFNVAAIAAFQLRLLDPPPPPDSDPPETTITQRPPEKTKRGKATFGFDSDEPGSTFQCAVDNQALKVPCTSPYTVRVKKGKHTFEVQAIDEHGNTDATPASDTWKRKKKKKKR